jgi:stringent starvation protein B
MPSQPSTRPYLIRAIHQWAVDNNLTPHILVDASVAGVKVPAGHARDGRVTLNIHPQAVRNLELGNEWLLFSARFGGNSVALEIPAAAVLAVYVRETGRGIFFQGEDEMTSAAGDPPPPSPDKPPAQKKGPQLKVVK